MNNATGRMAKDRHRHTDTQMHRHTDTQIHRRTHTDIQTPTHTHTDASIYHNPSYSPILLWNSMYIVYSDMLVLEVYISGSVWYLQLILRTHLNLVWLLCVAWSCGQPMFKKLCSDFFMCCWTQLNPSEATFSQIL